jgi:hypothetical protein
MAAPVLVPVPLRKLSKRHREFIKQFVLTGDELEAWVLAGYKGDKPASRSKARKLRGELSVYIDQELQTRIKSTDLAILGLNTIAELAKESNQDSTRLAAAKDILSRGGHDVVKEVKITHEKEMSDKEIQKRMDALKEKLWKDAPVIEVVEVVNEVQ